MATAQLNDKRLNQRLTQILSDLGDRPTASIPAACGEPTEMTGAYRFFDNAKVTPAAVLEPHFAATQQRLAEEPVVLLVQDTSEADLTRPHQQVEGAGPLDGGKRRGAFAHPVAVFTPNGTPLGTVSMPMWARAEPAPAVAAPTASQRRNRPLEEKESFRWVQGLRAARQVAQDLPQTQVVCIGDSDADLYELFAESRGEHPVDWLIRGCRDRCVEGEADAGQQKLRQSVQAAPVLFTHTVTVSTREPKTAWEKRSRRTGRTGRRATVEVRAATVTLHPPRRSGGVTQREPVPAVPPKLGVMVRLVAQLGGYVNRPNRTDPPGPQTVWLGLERMHDLAWAWNTFGPGANKDSNNPEDV